MDTNIRHNVVIKIPYMDFFLKPRLSGSNSAIILLIVFIEIKWSP